MKVLILSPHAEMLAQAVASTGDEPLFTHKVAKEGINYPNDILRPQEWPEADYVISFGYKYIIPVEIINKYKNKIINIHIGMLPYNRGASPNFWSWFDNTPKGVSIHIVDEGVDTGPYLCGLELMHFRYTKTLKTTYDDLIITAAGLFNREWKDRIRTLQQGRLSPYCRRAGSYHRAGEEKPFVDKLLHGIHSQVSEVEMLGQIYRGEMCKGG